MNIVPTNWTIAEYSVANGDLASARVPLYCDMAQQFLLAGYDWSPGPSWPAQVDLFGTPAYYVPIMLQPWAQFISVAVRAVGTDDASSLEISLRNSTNTSNLSVATVTLAGFEIDSTWTATVAESDLEVTNGVQWFGASVIGQTTPDADASLLQVNPSNEYVFGWIKIATTSAYVLEVLYRTMVSRAVIT